MYTKQEQAIHFVFKVFENKTRIKKKTFIKQLERYIIIELADKLHNMVSDHHLFLQKGKDTLTTLNRSYEDNKWYYTKMQELFNRKLKSNELLNRYNKFIDIYYNI